MKAGSIEIELLAGVARLQADMDRATRTVGGAMQKIEQQVKRTMQVFGGLVGAMGVKGLANIVDQYTKYTAQLRIATRSTQEYFNALSAVSGIARTAQADISAIGTLYARLSNSLREVGASQRQVGDITETVGLALKVYGATAQEASSAMLQLSQAFGAGALRGEEFNAVNEAAFPLMKALAESMGVPTGALKELAKQGAITREVMLNAWTNPKLMESLRQQASQVQTISGAVQTLKNSITEYVGELDKVLGSSTGAGNAIRFVADHLSELGNVILVAAVVGLGRYVSATVAATRAGMERRQELLKETIILERKAAADNAAAFATANNARAVTYAARRNSSALNESIAVQKELAVRTGIAATAMRGLGAVMAFLGGPIGLLITAIGGLAYAFSSMAKSAEKEAFPALDKLKHKIDEINRSQKLGTQANSPFAKELADIKELEITRDNLFKKLRAQQQSSLSTNGKGGFLSASTEEMTKTAIEYRVVAEELQAANARLEEAKKAASSEGRLDPKPVQQLAAATETATEKTKALALALHEADEMKADYFDGFIKTVIEENKAFDDADAAAYQRATDTLKAIDEQTAALQLEIDTYGKLPSAITDTRIAHLQQTKEALKNFGMTTEAIDQQIAALEKMRQLQSGKEALDAEKKANDERKRMAAESARDIEREYERLETTLTQSITDALFRGFENGKGFLENFKDTLINAFKTLILRPQIDFLVKSSGIAGLFGSGTAFGETAGIPTQAGGGFGGILSTGKTLFDGITKGFNSLNFGLQSSIEQLGANIANGMGGIRDAIGGFVGQNAGMIANGLAFLPAAFSLLQGDFKSAAFQGAGAAIGTAFGGPIGGAIGSFIGGAVGGLFGGKKEPPRTGAYVGGTFANGAYSPGYAVPYGSRYNAGFADSLGGLNSAFGQRLSGLLAGFGLNSTVGVSSGFNYKSKAAGNFDASFEGGSISFFSKYGKDAQAAFQSLIDTALGPLLIQAIQQTKLPQGIKQLFSAVSGTEQIDKLIAASINLNTAQEELADRFGLTVDAAAKVASATGLAGDAMIEFVNKLAGTAMSFKSQSEVLVETRAALIEGFQANTGEAITEAITRQVARQVQTRELVQGNWSMGGFSTAPFDRGTLLGGGQGPAYTASIMVTTTKTVFDTITDYVTKLLPSTKALPESLDEYDAVLKGIDKSTAAGIEQFEKLFAMREQFAQFTGAIDMLKAGVTGAVFSLMSPSQQLAQMQADLQTLFGNLGLTVPNSIQDLMALGNSIDYTTETGLDLAAAFPLLVQAFLNTKNGVEALATSLNELDPDRFRTLVDYRRAQAYARNGISLDMLPSYDVGTAYVPQDGPAMIHQGERIFTRTENGELMRRLSSKDDGMRVLADEVRGLREENRAMRDRLDKIADNTKRSRDVLEGSANGSTSLKTRAA